MAVAAALLPALGTSPAAAAASSTPGVTAKTITVGIPYVDIAYVDKTFGLKINQGSYPDRYTALFDRIERPRRHRRPQDQARLRRGEPHRDDGGGVLVHAAGRGRPRLRRLRAPERDLLPGARHTHHQRDSQRDGARQGCGQLHARATGRRIRPSRSRRWPSRASSRTRRSGSWAASRLTRTKR